ncbi:hypothetical protein DFH27DRAFT_534301 [Peziza echinospora]|nr:hypothetical protein DFH27DRAFT_534301 [Peziza echinospora]
MLGPDIPTYEEAISSRPRDAAAANEGSSEERAGLLHPGPSSNYRRPAVSDARLSEDSLLSGLSRRTSLESLHREIEQFEVDDGPSAQRPSSSRRAYQHLQKRISSLASSVSSSFPRIRFPSFDFAILAPLKRGLEAVMPYYRLFAIFFIMLLVYILLTSDLLNLRGNGFSGRDFRPDEIRDYAFANIDSNSLREYSEYLARFGHVAGSEGDMAIGNYLEGKLSNFGLSSVTKEHHFVHLNYPKPDGRSVQIVNNAGHMIWSAKLQEERESGEPNQPEVFNGYAKSGDAKGHLMYAGHGTPEEFRRLQADGVDFKGAVVIVLRKNSVQSDLGAIVKAAEKAGAVGCLLGSWDWDPPAFDVPEWIWKQMIKRGSVAVMSEKLGEVIPSEPAGSGHVNIPSMPLSHNDASYLIGQINKLGSPIAGTRWTGNASSVTVRIQNNLLELEAKQITNVFGQIDGIEQPGRKVIIGSHRDSFCFGASSPGSGTAIMLEVARIFGEMVSYGWRPVRTIVFASWDAGEYNRAGSTKWVEEHAEDLRKNGMAYINLDRAVVGDEFHAIGSPPLQSVLKSVLTRVKYPKTKTTLAELWGDARMGGLGAGSDYAAFQHYVGMSSIDLGFQGKPWPFEGSCVDKFETMQIPDAKYEMHKAIGQVVALLILELVDTSDMPFNMTNYATEATLWFSDLEKHVEDKFKSSSKKPKPLDLGPLREAVELMQKNMPEFDDKVKEWKQDRDGVSDVILQLDASVAAAQRISHNSRMANFEHHLLDQDGVWGRNAFKHVLMAPNREDGNLPVYFPSIRDAVDDDEWDAAQENVGKVAEKLKAATNKILH